MTDRKGAQFVATDSQLKGAVQLVQRNGVGGVRATTILDRLADGQGIVSLACEFNVAPRAIELLERLDSDLHDRREAIRVRPKSKQQKSKRPMLKLDSGPMLAERRRKVMVAACSLLAEGNPRSATVAEIAKRAGIARNTLYCIYPSTAEVIAAAFEWAAMAALKARHKGVPELSRWAEQNPPLVGTILLAGPVIDLHRYNALVADAATELDVGPHPITALDGALTVARMRAFRGEPINAELIHDLANFVGGGHKS